MSERVIDHQLSSDIISQHGGDSVLDSNLGGYQGLGQSGSTEDTNSSHARHVESYGHHCIEFIDLVSMMNPNIGRDEIREVARDFLSELDATVPLGFTMDGTALETRIRKRVQRSLCPRWDQQIERMSAFLSQMGYLGDRDSWSSERYQNKLVRYVSMWVLETSSARKASEDSSMHISTIPTSSSSSYMPAPQAIPQPAHESGYPNETSSKTRMTVIRALVTQIPSRPSSIKEFDLLTTIEAPGSVADCRQLYGVDIYGEPANQKIIRDIERPCLEFREGFDVETHPEKAFRWLKEVANVLRGTDAHNPIRAMYMHGQAKSRLGKNIGTFLSRSEVLAVPPEVKFAWLMASIEESFIRAKCNKTAMQEAMQFKYCANHRDVHHYMKELTEKFADAQVKELTPMDASAIKQAFFYNLNGNSHIKEIMDDLWMEFPNHLEFSQEVAKVMAKHEQRRPTANFNQMEAQEAEFNNLEHKRRRPDSEAQQQSLSTSQRRSFPHNSTQGARAADWVKRICRRCNDGIHKPNECMGQIYHKGIRCEHCASYTHLGENCTVTIRGACYRCGISGDHRNRGHNWAHCNASAETVARNQQITSKLS